MTSEKRFARLLEAIGRQARAQERRGRISPPKVTRARHRGPTRQELQAAMAWADGYLLQHGRLSPAARSALQGAVARRAMRQPKGDFSYRQPTQPTADQLAVLDQLYEGQRRAYLAEHPIRGAQGNYEPSGLKEEVGTALAALGFLAEPLGAPLAAVGVRLQVADIRRQLLDLSYQGESWMLDSLEGICPGQAGLEYPATSVPFSTSPVCPPTPFLVRSEVCGARGRGTCWPTPR
jgi:hypothetical protein